MSVTAAPAEEGQPATKAFAQVPLDILHAVCIELGGTRGACLAAALSARYGVAKAESAPVDRKAVGRATGAKPHAVAVALSRLCEANILARVDGGFRLNARPSTWAGLGPEKAREIRRMAGRKASRPRDEGRHAHVTHRHTTVTPPSHPCDQPSRPRDETSHHGDALLKKREIYTRETLSDRASEPRTDSRFFPDPRPEPEPTPAPPTPRMHPDATPEVRRELVERADAIRAGWGYECGGALLNGADPAHLREAFRRAERATDKPRHWNWVLKLLDDFKVEGIPKPKPRPGSREAMAAWFDRLEADQRAKGITPAPRPIEATWPAVEAVA